MALCVAVLNAVVYKDEFFTYTPICLVIRLLSSLIFSWRNVNASTGMFRISASLSSSSLDPLKKIVL